MEVISRYPILVSTGQEYNVLIDGGHAKHLSNIEKCMEEYGIMKKDDIQLHCIIVTHPDGDHMNGIKKLLEKHGREILNNCDVVLTRAFYWRSRDKMCEEFTTIIDSTCSKRTDNIEHKTCLSPGLQCHFPKEQGCLLSYTPKDDKSKATPTQQPPTPSKPKDADTNETSILTVINESKGKCDVVLTGDSNAKAILPLVEGKEIRIFQVPHHGSSFNSRLEDRTGTKLKEKIGRYDLSTIQDREVKEILLFYSRFKAQCYLISAGGTDRHNHPHSQVLQGIILANALQHQECVIILTNSRGLILQKIKPLHQVRIPEAQVWSRFVKIYHYNDVVEKQSDVVRLSPERCISDVRTGALEWTPEAYIRKIRSILSQRDPKMSNTRPQVKDCFIEKSRVEITLQGATTFSANVICVPVPHSPRSGDSINYCYVIEESIAPGMQFSQALFLLNDDKTTLPRAKNYILFQYTNNEWESKALGATVQDCTHQISAHNTSFGDINESLRRSGDKDKLVKFLVKGCGCQKPCDTDHCICRKNKCPCAPYCKCSNCKNNKVNPVSESNSSNESNQSAQPSQRSLPESSHSQQTKQPSQLIEPHSQPREPIRQPKQSSQLKKQDQPEQKFCRCRSGCDSNACGCKKRETHCGPRCKCGDNCKNNKQKQ